MTENPKTLTPDQLRQISAGAVLRLADGQFGQLYYLQDTTPPVPAVLLFGVALPQPLMPSDFPVELICERQVPRGPALQGRPDTPHPVLWHQDGSTTVLEPQE